VEQLFNDLGLSTTEAINIFYRQVKLRHGLPFPIVVPKMETVKTFDNTGLGKNLIYCESAEDMFEKLDI